MSKTYIPFRELNTGDICQHLDHDKLLLMKTPMNDKGVVLESVWISNKLYPRGTLLNMDSTACVIALDPASLLTLPILRTDPVDPRRTFWTEGATAKVGRSREAHVNLFAGLFLYSGLGMGTYYSGIEHEELWCGGTEARAHAEAEGVPFVHFDREDWTSDPTLKFNRDRAQADFAQSKASISA